ncbi:MAG: glycosyltransferase [Balneolaceae bacterium]|nr:glycosyltransferase [Balneolaceae bacterium]MCH8549389.1 glycosyltransferase [Balneolaceae bacterium]
MKLSVSVIIPVLNAADQLVRVLEAIEQQSYPRDRIEVIVIDNGSSDGLKEKIDCFGVKLLQQTKLKSPYASRNVGIEASAGEILAFTDANKVPDSSWIEKGVEALNRDDVSLAGGAIRFALSSKPTASEVYDSLMFNNNERLIREEGGAATGNLFVKREVPEKIGLFDGQHRSGMDLAWTRRAVENGFQLIYADEAVVFCEPRTFKQLLNKSYRIGCLFHTVNRYNEKPDLYTIQHTFRTFAPPKPSELRQRADGVQFNGNFSKLWMVAWLNRVAMALGRIRGLKL